MGRLKRDEAASPALRCLSRQAGSEDIDKFRLHCGVGGGRWR